MSDLMNKLLKLGSIKNSNVLSKSIFFNKKDNTPTKLPILNLALSGEFDEGLEAGLTLICGPSKHYKSNLGLAMVEAYLNKNPEGLCMFYDSEYGITKEMLLANGVDPNRVIHVPITNIEEFRFDLTQRLEGIERDDKIIIFIDSIGNLASKKEVDDTLDGKSVTDMTRAKSLKGTFRVLTPILTTKNIPCVAINHTYQTLEMFSKAQVSGGTGIYYSASTIFILGRQQEKDGTDIVGWNFIINIEKSRFVKEKSKLPILVTYDHGISKWSGILDLALESGHVIKPKNGWYALVNKETGEVGGSVRFEKTQNENFLGKVLADDDFKKFARDKYKLQHVVNEVSDDSLDTFVDEVLDTSDDSATDQLSDGLTVGFASFGD